MSVRPPAVAGFFYPDQPALLRRDVDALLAEAPPRDISPKALVVPHAGYVYSGPVAARAYRLLQGMADRIRRVVLLGPSHRVALRGIALPGDTHFATPLGMVEIDSQAVERLQSFPQVRVMPEAHLQEHSLEVQLPFLQRALGAFKLLPLVVGQVEPHKVREVLETLWGGDETLILISSDLSHYHDYATAQQLDRATSEAICGLQSDLVGEQACGCFPLNGFLQAAGERRLRSELLDLRNSGDTAGSRDRVVGYGAYAFY